MENRIVACCYDLSAPRFKLAMLLLAIGVFAVALGLGAGYFDYRLPWGIRLFPPGRPSASKRRQPIIGAPAGITATIVRARVALIGWLWLSWEPMLGAIDPALAQLPEEAREMVVSGPTATTSAGRNPSLLHVAAYLVARRHVFETNIDASIPGQILELQPAWVPDHVVVPPEKLDAASLLALAAHNK